METLANKVRKITKTNASYDGKEYQDNLVDFADTLREYILNTDKSDFTKILEKNMDDFIDQNVENFVVESFSDMDAYLECFIVVHKKSGKGIYLSANKDS